jgi:hypothetical protein
MEGRDGMADEQYYALCVEDEAGTTEVAYFELGEGAVGALGMSVYTAPDGERQRRHLEDIDDVDIVIAPKSHEELLGAMYTGVPSSVYVDGERISGSVFKARLENALGIPVRQPRIVRLYLDPE